MVVLLLSSAANASELGINLHGFSYHPDRRDSSGKEFNELNPGLGLHWIARTTKRSLVTGETGLYLNSVEDPAVYVSCSWKFRFTQSLSAGIAGTLLYSASYNEGRPVVAPVPVITYRFRKAAASLIYFPRYKEVNRNAVFGMYFTVFPH